MRFGLAPSLENRSRTGRNRRRGIGNKMVAVLVAKGGNIKAYDNEPDGGCDWNAGVSPATPRFPKA